MSCSSGLFKWRQKAFFLTGAVVMTRQYIKILFQKYEQKVNFIIFLTFF